MKKMLRIFLRNTLYTRHIHTNMLCRIRFLAIRAIAGPKYCPASPAYCPTCKYRCLQRGGYMIERAIGVQSVVYPGK